MSKRSWIFFIIIIIGIMGALITASKSGDKKIDISSVDASAIQVATESNGNIADHTEGNLDSKIVLIEYGDFQCPPCGSAHPIIKDLIQKYSDKMVFVFRNFPIPSLHPNARAASASAEAAGLQGKYWEMHNMLFENQSDWSSASVSDRTDVFRRYAQELGLDIEKFLIDVGSESVVAKIDFDTSLGKSINVDATPTLKLNGEDVNVNNLEDSIKAKL